MPADARAGVDGAARTRSTHPAAGVVGAAANPPRELWPGLPAVQAILGAMVAPGLADRHLARTGYEGQISAVPVRPGDPDTLLGPAARAKGRVFPTDPLCLRGALALAGCGLAAGTFFPGARRGGSRAARCRPTGGRAAPPPASP